MNSTFFYRGSTEHYMSPYKRGMTSSPSVTTRQCPSELDTALAAPLVLAMAMAKRVYHRSSGLTKSLALLSV